MALNLPAIDLKVSSIFTLQPLRPAQKAIIYLKFNNLKYWQITCITWSAAREGVLYSRNEILNSLGKLMNKFKALIFAGLAAGGLFAGQAYATPTNFPPPPGAIFTLDGKPLPSASFQQYSVNFTATDAVTHIKFAERDDPSYTYLDNVSVSNTNTPGINLIQNGGFEDGKATSGGNFFAPVGWTYQNPDGVPFTGTVGCVPHDLFAIVYAGSCSWVDQASGAYDSISQSINTIRGDTYQLTFYAYWYAPPSFDSPPYWSEISTNGLPGLSANGINIAVYANAASPPSTAVPEPAELGMFGLGVLLIGLFASLRRRFDQGLSEQVGAGVTSLSALSLPRRWRRQAGSERP